MRVLFCSAYLFLVGLGGHTCSTLLGPLACVGFGRLRALHQLVALAGFAACMMGTNGDLVNQLTGLATWVRKFAHTDRGLGIGSPTSMIC